MKSKKNDRIVRDLLGVFVKYESSDISDALDAIKHAEVLNDFVALASTLNREFPRQVSKRRVSASPVSSGARSKERLSRMISELNLSHQADHEVADLLSEIIDGKLLASVRSLRSFSEAIGMPPLGAKAAKYDIVRKIGERLLELPPVARSEIRQLAREMSNGTSSLQQWSDIIVKPTK